MRRVWCYFQTVVFVTICSAQSSKEYPMVIPQIEVPKCCTKDKTFDLEEKTCSKTIGTVNYEHDYFYSNETYISTNPVKFIPKFYKANPQCIKKNETFMLDKTNILGFIYNNSIIENVSIQYSDEAIISPDNYCVFEQDGRIVFLICTGVSGEEVIVVYLPCKQTISDYSEDKIKIRNLRNLKIFESFSFQEHVYPKWIVLILSTLCYFFSAFVYGFILKVQQVQKKCFIGFALSMGVTFTFLIILQTTEKGCDAVGSFFFFFVLSSFVWLACLCFELILMVRNFKEDTDENRIRIYLATSLAFPTFVLLLSMVPYGKPDVPHSFMKPREGRICQFEDASMLYFFIAIGVLMFSGLISLGYNFHLMGRMERKYKNHYSWLENKSKFKYMSISCSLIWLTSAIWIIDTAVRDFMITGNPDVYDVIESLQGIFTVAIFVTDRYTRKEVYANLTAGSDTNSEGRRHIRTIRWLTKKFSSKPKTSTENPDEEHAHTG